MELKERTGKYGNIIYFYDEVEPNLLEIKAGDRVLPAPFFYEKKLVFTVVRKYEPNQHRWFPNGGFYLRGPAGEFRAFDLDQIILHPEIFEKLKRKAKIEKRREKEEAKRLRSLNKIRKEHDKKETKGKRGRPKLSEEEKAKIAAAPIDPNRKKRGRKPMDPVLKAQKEAAKNKAPGEKGKRGRPALDPELKAQREKEKVERSLRSGGKRGRPAKNK